MRIERLGSPSSGMNLMTFGYFAKTGPTKRKQRKAELLVKAREVLKMKRQVEKQKPTSGDSSTLATPPLMHVLDISSALNQKTVGVFMKEQSGQKRHSTKSQGNESKN
ncbi:hypothetical protein SK128_017376 [Halocaridina rubra]|uniref:Uncharacterized protein n=1 Tax=Halocaridina rubra TaxID=373956 RepID=A0AAN8XMN4_HALRR